jgi:hypothetical protein
LHCRFGPVPDIGSSGGNCFEVVVARSKNVRLLEFNELFSINAINEESTQFPHINNASMHWLLVGDTLGWKK